MKKINCFLLELEDTGIKCKIEILKEDNTYKSLSFLLENTSEDTFFVESLYFNGVFQGKEKLHYNILKSSEYCVFKANSFLYNSFDISNYNEDMDKKDIFISIIESLKSFKLNIIINNASCIKKKFGVFKIIDNQQYEIKEEY